MVIQIASLVTLARLLTPEDFGLYGMVAVFAGLGLLIGDFGLASASIQARAISHQQRTNLFWASLVLGLATTLVFGLLAMPIANLFGQDQLTEIVIVVAVIFTVQGATAQFVANATRELRFTLLASGEVASQAAGFAVAIAMAILGAGVWALVGQQVTIAVVVLAIYTIASRWRPGLPRRAPMRALFVFGANTSAVQILNYMTSKVDSFLIGKFYGAVALGIYDRAYQVNQIPTQQLATPLTRVALPLLSKYQDDVEGMQSRLLVLSRLMAFVLGGLILFIGANSTNVVEVALGEQWRDASALLSLLAVGGFFQAVGYVYYWAFLSLGRTGLQLRFSLGTRPMMVVFICAGLLFGPAGVALAVSLGLAVNWLVLTVFALPRVGIRAWPFMAVVIRSFAMMLPTTFAVGFAQATFFPGLPPVVALAINAVATFGLISSFLAIPAYRRDLRSIADFVRTRG